MRINRALALLTASTAFTASWSTPAAAQSAPVPPVTTGQPPEADTPTASAAVQDEAGRIPDIIVTAQRRGQNLQQVPIAVTAATAETLGNLGIRSTSDLGTIAPAVTFAVGNGGAAVNIRGVGGTGAGSDEAANSLYIDGVYIPAPVGGVFQFNNIERVEILKGPQGTLFGRNASGGLIQIITPEPKHDLEAAVEVGYGNYSTVHSSATVSGGITDSLAISLSGVYDRQNDGWGRNVTTHGDAFRGQFYGGHFKAVWHIDPDTKVIASALYGNSRPASVQGLQILPGERLAGGGQALGFYDQTENTAGYNRMTDANFSLTITHAFSWANLTSITSRDLAKSKATIDADLSAVNLVNVSINGPIRSWTQEFQLGSPTGSKIQWIAGLFYYYNDLKNNPFRTYGAAFAPLAFADTDSDQQTNSYAAYGQTTVPVTKSTNLTAGLRYTIDKRELDDTTLTSNTAVPPKVYPTAHSEYKKLTWRFAIDQKLADRVLAYASYSRGFKSGLYNQTNPGTPPVKPQTIDAYEIGLKSDLFDRRVRLNLSAFHYNLDDVQLRAILPGNPTPIFYNAAKAHLNGAEAEVNLFVTSRFSVDGNLAFLSGHYKSFPDAVYYQVNGAPAFGLTLLPPSDASGNQTVYSPRWVTNLSAQYKMPTSIGTFTLAGTWNYNSGFYFDPQNRVADPSYHLVNGTLTWAPREGLYARLYVNNLLKEKYYTTVTPSNFGDYYFPAAPRTYGVTLGAKF